jgi:hypothetical protein
LLFPEFSESGMEQKPTAAPAKKKNKKSPQSRKELRRQKNLGKVEEKKTQRKPFREWEELHTLS